MVRDASLRQTVGIDQQLSLLRQNAVEIVAFLKLPT